MDSVGVVFPDMVTEIRWLYLQVASSSITCKCVYYRAVARVTEIRWLYLQVAFSSITCKFAYCRAVTRLSSSTENVVPELDDPPASET